MNVQIAVMADKTIIGNIMFSYCPMEADFSKLIPTPSGRISAKNLNPFGKISAGIVTTKKSSIGKAGSKKATTKKQQRKNNN